MNQIEQLFTRLFETLQPYDRQDHIDDIKTSIDVYKDLRKITLNDPRAKQGEAMYITKKIDSLNSELKMLENAK
jgi:hypothetical protein